MTGSLYIHIPFCIRKCLYCDFLSVPYEKTLVGRYVDALCRELELRKDLADTLKTVYFGGGTPSLLPEESLCKLFACLQVNFRLLPEAEVSMEANPGAVSRFSLELLVSLGLNRLSIGIQSFDDGELRTLGRIHTSAEGFEAARLIRDAGLKNWSLDLMYGIPGQTAKSWQKTLSAALQMSPSHISAYELTPEAGTPMKTLLREGTLTMPAEDDILRMYDLAVNTLGAAGYRHYEVSNYAQPGFECRHNLNYWDRGEYVGAGAGAHSFVEGMRSSNAMNIEDYIRLLSAGSLPEEESSIVAPADAAREFIFLGLRKTAGISIGEGAAYGLNLAESSMRLIADGYLEREGDYIRLSPRGLVISNTVIVKLFEAAGL